MSLRHQLQNMLVNFKMSRLKQPEILFPTHLKKKNRIIITLPEGIQTNSVLLRMIAELPEIFHDSELLVVVPLGCTEVSRKTGIHAMSPDLYATNALGLPKRNFFAKVKNYKATMAIDFETHRNIFNALVAMWSGAPLRIGLDGVWGAPLHNCTVKSQFATDELKVYRSLVDVLAEIQKPPTDSDFFAN